MTQDNWPKPKWRGFLFLVPDADTRFPALDRDAARAARPVPRRVRTRVVTDSNRRYTAYEANSLLEHEDPQQLARPGHPLG